MEGGSNIRIIPTYNNKVSKEINEKEKIVEAEKAKQPYKANQPQKIEPNKSGMDPLLDLKIFDNKPSKPAFPKPAIEQLKTIPDLPIFYQNPQYPPQFQNYLPNLISYSNYNLNVNPSSNHAFNREVFQGLLPPRQAGQTYLTMKERKTLYNTIRPMFIDEVDGEITRFDGKRGSIITKTKLLELTPFFADPENRNIYIDRPNDLLLYSSCYPIVYSDRRRTCECDEKHVILNLRFYNISVQDLQLIHCRNILAQDADDRIKIENYRIESDIYRELCYYQYIRDNVISFCPHFINMYCYMFCTDVSLDFDKVPIKMKKKSAKKPTKNNGCMLIITEAATYSMYDWMENKCVKNKNIVDQINLGYKSPETWNVILFQMYLVFYTMIIKEFTFNDMHPNNNFFIKIVNSSENDQLVMLKYTIDDIDFFIPNTGFILLCNSDYHDLENNQKRKFFMKGHHAGDFENKTILHRIRENMMNCFDLNEYKKKGLIHPDDSVLKFMERIRSAIQLFDWDNKNNLCEAMSKSFYEFFGMFLHNRLGQALYAEEANIIVNAEYNKLRKGQIVVCDDKLELILEKNGENDIKLSNNTTKTISDLMVMKYDDFKQNKGPNEPYLTTHNIIEQYYIKK